MQEMNSVLKKSLNISPGNDSTHYEILPDLLPVYKTNQQNIDALHHMALPICIDAYCMSPIKSILVDADDFSLSLRRNVWFQHYLSRKNGAARNPNRLTGLPNGGRYSQFGPCTSKPLDVRYFE
ncbi:hypothetical protein SK128_016469 [Halocaridina rubra]|uniref:Uncharacterized protein n=1 Tax=Halocaridina rubra TaxID=373956 RepID=A0AAN9AA47_HALRR